MNENNEQGQSVDINEYLAILWRRKWLIVVCFVFCLSGMIVFLLTQPTIWRVNAKLLITKTGSGLPAADITHEDTDRFIPTQIEIITGQTVARRIQQRMKKTPEQIGANIKSFKVGRSGGTDILLVTVDSPSQEFAREFISAALDEYLKVRERQRVATAETAVQSLTREIDRLGLELKSANQRLFDFTKEHNVAAELIRSAASGGGNNYGSGSDFFERWRHHANIIMHAGEDLADAVARKQLLDARPNAAAVLALLADERAAAAEERAAESVTTGEINAGNILNISIPQSKMLDGRITVAPDLTVQYAPLGKIDVTGLTTEMLATKIQHDLVAASLIKDLAANETIVRVTISSGTSEATGNPLSANVFGTAVTRTTMGALQLTEIDKLFTLDRRRLAAQTRVDSLRKLYKSKHPALMPAEQELQSAIEEEDATVQFYRQKADAEVLIAERKYASLQAAGKQLEAEALLQGTQLQQVRLLREDADRLRTLYNTLLGQLTKLDITQNFKTYNVSLLEAPFVDPIPVSPKKVKSLLMAGVLGLAIGGALAFFLVNIDDPVKLAEAFERDLKLPFLGLIPFASWSLSDLTFHRLDRHGQYGETMEAYRVVRSALLGVVPREKLHAILLTSTVPGEGKTTTAVNLAIGLAQIEERVLLIDADLRRGGIHKYFNFEPANGLVDILTGDSTPEKAVHQTEVHKLHVITAGAYPTNPTELLLNHRLEALLRWARQHYDRILVDGPPITGVADSSILSTVCDDVLLVIRPGRTLRKDVLTAKATAADRGANFVGFILNDLHADTHRSKYSEELQPDQISSKVIKFIPPDDNQQDSLSDASSRADARSGSRNIF
ncbi:MAG: polysaccharide biosynthesis tyrosine autokinase [Verrucomicrobiota bacterium]|jgi:capsular exopolysaccharide synthesis family protein